MMKGLPWDVIGLVGGVGLVAGYVLCMVLAWGALAKQREIIQQLRARMQNLLALLATADERVAQLQEELDAIHHAANLQVDEPWEKEDLGDGAADELGEAVPVAVGSKDVLHSIIEELPPGVRPHCDPDAERDDAIAQGMIARETHGNEDRPEEAGSEEADHTA